MFQAGILNTYRNDFGKYAKTTRHKYLEKIFERAPGVIAQRFQYSKIDPHMQSRELKPSLEDLVNAGLIYIIHCSRSTGLPLNANVNEKKFKLLFLDIGLVKQTSMLEADLMLRKDLMLVNRGALVEQFVGQELLTQFPPYLPGEIFYWEREKKGSAAEVDYVMSVDDAIIPIEVKAGKTGTLRSLQLFLNEKQSPFGVRVSMKPLSFKNRVLSVPLYMLHELKRLVRELL